MMLSFLLCGLFVVICNAGWVKEMENPNLYEGDMILDPGQMEEAIKGSYSYGSVKDGLWPGGVIPYQIHSSLRSQSKFQSELKASIANYHKYTCLKFVQRSNQRNYIEFTIGRGGCSSPVGTRGGRNGVNLSKGCWWRSTIMHEIGHSIGLHHEQSRPDRDNHVQIIFGNIANGLDFNFKKQTYSKVDSRGTPYDYWSMMHYGYSAFGSGKMTIKTKDPRFQYEIGQDRGFSPIDVIQINKMYKCGTNYPSPPAFKIYPGCYNLGGACASGAYEGNCNKPAWKSYMHSKCKKACGLCGGGGVVPTHGPIPTGGPRPTHGPPTQGPPSSCRDKHTNCWQNRYDCNKFPTHYRKYCAKTCKFC